MAGGFVIKPTHNQWNTRARTSNYQQKNKRRGLDTQVNELNVALPERVLQAAGNGNFLAHGFSNVTYKYVLRTSHADVPGGHSFICHRLT